MAEQNKSPIGDALALNRSALEPLLAPLRKHGIGHLIDGVRSESISAATFASESPVDGSLIARVARGQAADIDRAANAAMRAFPTWRAMVPAKRRELMHAIAACIEAHAQEIALLESWDSGQPLRFMSKAAERGAENFRFYADRIGEARNGRAMPDVAHLNYSVRQPIGPVGVITPWNTPFMLSTWKIAPALAAGCTVVHKPAEWSPVSADLLGQICLDAGLPAGVLNVVQGMGEEAGKALTQHALIQAIAFVGESATGSAIMAQGAPTLKRVHFELGGKNPVIVFKDADLERALNAVVFMIYSLNGERCTSSSRLLIDESIAPEFLARVAQRVRRLKVGHPLDPHTEVGPLIHARHKAKVLSYFDVARDEGVMMAAGGAALDGPGGGHYVAPTLLTGATRGMRVAREEIFGPVLTTLTFRDESEAIAVANDVRFGLAGYIWTSDLSRALRVSEALDVGMIWINSENVRHLQTPFGGMKASGIGRDGGDHSFEFYMETKNIALAHGTHTIPVLGR